MFIIKYFKADASTYVIKSINGKIRQQGKGLSFFYDATRTSIAAIPVSAQEAPFIFTLTTADFQELTVQGQVTFRVVQPELTAEMLNFNVVGTADNHVSEDPLRLEDAVVRAAQSLIQQRVQSTGIRQALLLAEELTGLLEQRLPAAHALQQLGLEVVDITISAVSPTTETARALEAEARESILKEADDAIYARRKFAVEQERTIKEAELQTALSVQQKEQEIAESRVANERALMRSRAQTEHERIQTEIEAEARRAELVELGAQNDRIKAESEAYAIEARSRAAQVLPAEHIKAMALAKMDSSQLMAMAFDTLAGNAERIGELNLTPDLLGQAFRKTAKRSLRDLKQDYLDMVRAEGDQ